MVNDVSLKGEVRDYWEQEACGARQGDTLDAVAEHRQQTHPYLESWANYAAMRGKQVLEIGLGTGVDLCRWASAGATATGIDLTRTAVETALARAREQGLTNLTAQVGDAENLPFPAESFDLVYSFGVLHHTPNTARAFSEAYRVLKPGGTIKAMIYRIPSLTGFLLALLYRKSPRQAIYDHLESPGTKAYTDDEARQMLTGIGFRDIVMQVELGPGDTLEMKLSAKYRNPIFSVAKALYPGWLVKAAGKRLGLFLLLTATKPG